jgi:hypothetical protein
VGGTRISFALCKIFKLIMNILFNRDMMHLFRTDDFVPNPSTLGAVSISRRWIDSCFPFHLEFGPVGGTRISFALCKIFELRVCLLLNRDMPHLFHIDDFVPSPPGIGSLGISKSGLFHFSRFHLEFGPVGGTRISFALCKIFKSRMKSLLYQVMPHLFPMAYFAPSPTTIGPCCISQKNGMLSAPMPKGFLAVWATRISFAFRKTFKFRIDILVDEP